MRLGLRTSSLAFVSLALLALPSRPARAAEPAIVVASRLFEPRPEGEERTQAVDRAREGKLLVREADGTVRVLVDATGPGAPPGTPTDVMTPSVSFDATRIVFSGLSPSEGAWRLFEVLADGTGLRQITHSDRQTDLARYGEAAAHLADYDDTSPCYLPDGRICFTSTRYPEIAPDRRLRSTNLYVVNADGSDLHRITTERFAADTPTVEPSTGRIVFSRWWRTPPGGAGVAPIADSPPTDGYGSPPESNSGAATSPDVLKGVALGDFPGVNSWFLSSIAPDGNDLAMFSGFRLNRELTQAYRPSFLPSGEVLALFIPVTPLLGRPGENGLRRYSAGPGVPTGLGGPQRVIEHRDSSLLVYSSAAALADGRVLVSASTDRTKYDVYIQDLAQGGLSLLFALDQASLLDAVPLEPQPVPPVIPDRAAVRMVDEAPRDVAEAIAAGGTFTFLCENIHSNAGLDVPIANAPPVGKGLVIEFFTSPQRTGVAAADPALLVDRQEIGPDGRIEVKLPAGVPLFEVLRRPDGSLAVGRDGQIFHVGGLNYGTAGQEGKCVGCHAGHSMQTVPEDATWTNLAPSAVVRQLSRGNPGGVFAPHNLVDRTSTENAGVWSAGANAEPVHRVQLRWSVPLGAREAIVYGPTPGSGLEVRALTLRTLLGGERREEQVVQETIRREGIHVVLDPALAFDALVIEIRAEDVSGTFADMSGPALAEVEVLARVAQGAFAPTAAFVRGDANCDSHVNFSDAVALLDGLFKGQTLCCAAAADVTADGRLNLTDPLSLLQYNFQGGDPPAAPFDSCGVAPVGDSVCDQEVCP